MSRRGRRAAVVAGLCAVTAGAFGAPFAWPRIVEEFPQSAYVADARRAMEEVKKS